MKEIGNCPECNSGDTEQVGNEGECNVCGHAWPLEEEDIKCKDGSCKL